MSVVALRCKSRQWRKNWNRNLEGDRCQAGGLVNAWLIFALIVLSVSIQRDAPREAFTFHSVIGRRRPLQLAMTSGNTKFLSDRMDS